MIKINDPIYGSFELPQIFEDLLKSTAVQRLSKIHHSGAIFLVNSEICHTRLDHSIGVMLLIRLLGGTELEQLAGLLHDLSHTAFSHVGDYVFDNKEETYHELLYESVIRNSDLPMMLEKHGYQLQHLLDGGFSLLEQPLPGLCADRLDYTLRDSIHAKLITCQHARSFIKHLAIEDNKIVIKGECNGDWINHTFDRLNRELFNAPLYVYANQQLSILIRELLKRGEIEEEDMMKDDTYLLNKIRSTVYGDDAIQAIIHHKDFAQFLKNGPSLKIKERYLRARVAELAFDR